MVANAPHFITEEEYQRLEEISPVKHEYSQGRMYAMSGGSNAHAILCTNAAITTGSRLRGKECLAVGSEQRVKIEATGLQTYPDVAVYCPPARFEGKHNEVLLNPRVIIEVLSPSTERYDRGKKFENYRQIESLTDYILITQERVLAEHFRRQEDGGWLLRSYNAREDRLILPELEIELPLDEIYDRLDVPSGLLLMSEDGLEE